jgi:hypothetical protein
MDFYVHECTQYIYNFGQPCLTLITSYTIITYDNYNTIEKNQTFINNFFAIILQLLYATTQLLAKLLLLLLLLYINIQIPN